MLYFDLIAHKPTCKVGKLVNLLTDQLAIFFFLLANKYDPKALAKIVKT